MNKNILLCLGFIFWTGNAMSLTPQKYCESLAASSCELLNTEVVSGNASYWELNVKYCKDRVFKVKSFGLNTGYFVSTNTWCTTPQTFYDTQNGNSTKSLD